jgi:hypothetical protein
MGATPPEDGFHGSFAPIRWRRIQAINGRGQILIGPNEMSDREGAMVIAPPGVLLRAPAGQMPLCRNGWREARWSPDADGCVLIDQARPDALVEVSLGQVVEDLAAWAPDQLRWVASVIERQLRVLVGRMARDCHGRMHPKAATAFDELVETKHAADSAFACLRNLPCKTPELFVDGYFNGLVRIYVSELESDREWFKRSVEAVGERAYQTPEVLKGLCDPDAPAPSNLWDAP